MRLDSTADLDEVRARIEACRQSVESVERVDVVTDLGIFANNPTIGVLMHFRDQAAFDRCMQDPNHLAVHEYMHPITNKLWSLQFETPRAAY